MPGFANRQIDRLPCRIGRYVGEPLPQPLERIGLQERKARIQEDEGPDEAKSIRDARYAGRIAAGAD